MHQCACILATTRYSRLSSLQLIGFIVKIYNDKFEEMVFISAKYGIDGIINNDEELINKSNIKQLYELIDKNFKIKSEEEQIKSKYQNIVLKTHSD